jgi:hypothetical protein
MLTRVEYAVALPARWPPRTAAEAKTLAEDLNAEERRKRGTSGRAASTVVAISPRGIYAAREVHVKNLPEGRDPEMCESSCFYAESRGACPSTCFVVELVQRAKQRRSASAALSPGPVYAARRRPAYSRRRP